MDEMILVVIVMMTVMMIAMMIGKDILKTVEMGYTRVEININQKLIE